MKIRNLPGPSGVPLGGTGVGYFEISPDGKLTRNCVGNIHRSIIDTPKGFFCAVHDGRKAVRLQRDNRTEYGMTAYENSEYKGLWPRMELEFEKNGERAEFSAFSGVVSHDVKNSSLPAVYFTVKLTNTSEEKRTMSAVISWGDQIGRGLRDTDRDDLADFNGDSDAWHDMAYPDTFADAAFVTAEQGSYAGIRQFAKEKIIPRRATFQNYNNAFMLLGETGENRCVTILKSYDVNNDSAFASFIIKGSLDEILPGEVNLSAAEDGRKRHIKNASAVCVSAEVGPGECEAVRFVLTWFMPEFTDDDYASMRRFAQCDYGKYYHRFFGDIDSHTEYAIASRDEIYSGIMAWQKPILDSTLPEWMRFKLINSGYALYTNGVLNKKGNFSTLEGEMGGYGGTMDQKMSSYVFYEKFFPELNLAENLQYANVTGAHGEIQHFDVHYYYGMSDSDPGHRENPTPAGSMTDNTGSWMMQMWNHYRHTGDFTLLEKYYDVMKTSMAFIQSKCPEGTHIPSYNTTYDDYRHPPVMIYSAPVWLLMLKIGARWAVTYGDSETAEAYLREYDLASADTAVLFGDWNEDHPAYYAFGSDGEFIRSQGKAGHAETDVMFSGAMAGQFMSRYLGLGDVIPFDAFVSHIKAFLETSVQNSRDYYAPKVYNIRTEQDMDNDGSRCWPFYLESYGAMAAVTAGYADDGMKIQKHAMEVDLRLGFMWTRNLWNRGYVTYMTAPVTWMIGDVLAGCSVDIPDRTLTLGCVYDGVIPLNYPNFSAVLTNQNGRMTFAVTETFSDNCGVIEKIRITPVGKAYEEGITVVLNTPFSIKKGAVLDLSAHKEAFTGTIYPSSLQPVEKYERPKPERPAMGTGLDAEISFGGEIHRGKLTKTECVFDQNHPLTENVGGEFEAVFTGSLLPRFGQKYQLIFEYTGMLDVTFYDGAECEYSDRADDIESLQYVPKEGMKLLVVTRSMEAGMLCPMKIRYSGNTATGENRFKLLWWSTTQQMSTIIKERLYSPAKIGEKIDGAAYIGKTDCFLEHNHVSYVRRNCYALYDRIDFSSGGQDFIFRIHAAAPRNHVSDGGFMDVHLDSVDGPLLGTMEFTPTGDWNNFREFTVHLHSGEPISGARSICLVFRPFSEFLMNYTDFTISAQE